MTTKRLTSVAVAIAAFGMACADPATSPNGVLMPSGVTQAIIEDNDGTPPLPVLAGYVEVCKVANATGTFGFTWSYPGVAGGAAQALNIDVTTAGVPACVTLPFHSSTSLAGGQETVVVTEDADQTNWALSNIDVTQYLFASIVSGAGYTSAQLADTESEVTRTATMYINSDMSRSVTFTNTFTAPGDEGCTPGYWKQPHHADSWLGTGYALGDDFDTVFGVNFFSPNITLLTALGLNGGGKNALARHAVAALLNAASAGVDYPLTTAQVIAAVQAAYATPSTIESTKNTLAANNELGCPLN